MSVVSKLQFTHASISSRSWLSKQPKLVQSSKLVVASLSCAELGTAQSQLVSSCWHKKIGITLLDFRHALLDIFKTPFWPFLWTPIRLPQDTIQTPSKHPPDKLSIPSTHTILATKGQLLSFKHVGPFLLVEARCGFFLIVTGWNKVKIYNKQLKLS